MNAPHAILHLCALSILTVSVATDADEPKKKASGAHVREARGRVAESGADELHSSFVSLQVDSRDANI